MALMPGGVINSGMSGALSREVLDPSTTLNMDPGFQRNLLLEQARREVEGSGKRPGERGFSGLVMAALNSRGLSREAKEAETKSRKAEIEAVKAQILKDIGPGFPQDTRAAMLLADQLDFNTVNPWDWYNHWADTIGQRLAERQQGEMSDLPPPDTTGHRELKPEEVIFAIKKLIPDDDGLRLQTIRDYKEAVFTNKLMDSKTFLAQLLRDGVPPFREGGQAGGTALPPLTGDAQRREQQLKELDPSKPLKERRAISRQEKLFNKTMDNLTRPMGGLEAQRFRLPNGEPADPSKSLLDNLERGAKLVDPVAAATRRADQISRTATNLEAEETLLAVKRMEDIIKDFRKDGSVKGVLSAIAGRAGITSDQGVYSAALSRIAKAIAQLRNPGSAEAAREAELRLNETFPSLEIAISMDVLDGLLEYYKVEANDRLGRKGTGVEKLIPVTPNDPGDTGDPLIDKWLRKSIGQ